MKQISGAIFLALLCVFPLFVGDFYINLALRPPYVHSYYLFYN